MKKSKIIIFSITMALLLFANIKVTLFDGTEKEVSFQLNNTEASAIIIDTKPDNGGGGYSCTVTTNCYDGTQQIQGTISCTGNESCSRGLESVTCDNITTTCH